MMITFVDEQMNFNSVGWDASRDRLEMSSKDISTMKLFEVSFAHRSSKSNQSVIVLVVF